MDLHNTPTNMSDIWHLLVKEIKIHPPLSLQWKKREMENFLSNYVGRTQLQRAANKQWGRWEDCRGRNRSGAAGRTVEKTTLNDAPASELAHLQVSWQRLLGNVFWTRHWHCWDARRISQRDRSCLFMQGEHRQLEEETSRLPNLTCLSATGWLYFQSQQAAGNYLCPSHPFKVPYTSSHEIWVSGPKEAMRTGIYPAPWSGLPHNGLMVCLCVHHAGTVVNKFCLLSG